MKGEVLGGADKGNEILVRSAEGLKMHAPVNLVRHAFQRRKIDFHWIPQIVCVLPIIAHKTPGEKAENGK